MVKTLALLITFTLSVIFSSTSYAQTLSVQVDRATLAQEESLQLIIALQGQSNASPDLSPLEQDFDVVSSSKNFTMNLVNGRMDSKTQWQITLIPKRSGTIRIPALAVAGELTEPIDIVVRPTNSGTATTERRTVFLEVTATPSNLYVQSQALITVRLYYAVPINQARMADPRLSDAVVERLGEDKNFETVKDGQRYRVLERVYAVFPQNSGELTIPALELNGQITEAGASPIEQFFNNNGLGFDPFDQSLQRTRPIRLRSAPLRLSVRPRPANFQGTVWLPAQALRLTETWNPSNPTFRVGEPITRSITLEAKGLAAAQLPDLSMSSDASIKTYPDQPQLKNRPLDDGIQGTRSQNVALVPTRPGTFTLPAIHLNWWDTLANQERIATLPAKTVTVLPALNGNAISGASDASPIVTSPTPSPTLPAVAPRAENSPTVNYWSWIAAFFFVIWLITLTIWRQDRRQRQTTVSLSLPQSHRQPPTSTKPSLNALQTACETNQAAATKEHLLHWAAARWPNDPPRSVGEIAARLRDNKVTAVLTELDKAIYAKAQDANWNGGACWAVLKNALTHQPSSEHQTEMLPALYPPAH